MRAVLFLVILVGCEIESTKGDTGGDPVTDDTDAPGPDTDTPGSTAQDLDDDGFASPDDCDDADPAVNPDADEICDERDNNCDQQVDEGVTQTFYTDADGDGFGDAAAPIQACATEAGIVDGGTD